MLILHEGCLLSFVGHAWDTGEILVSKPGPCILELSWHSFLFSCMYQLQAVEKRCPRAEARGGSGGLNWWEVTIMMYMEA